MYSNYLLATARLFSSSAARKFSTSTAIHYPKIKSHSGTKKRWKSIASGVFKRGQAGHSHLNESKRPGRINRLGGTVLSHGAQTTRLKKLLPYGS